MGRFTAWLARRGAPGGTARWAIKGHRFFRNRHPDPEEFPDRLVFRLMVVHRYERLKNEHAEQALLAEADEVDGLMGLVVEILRVEAALADNAPEGMATILAVIQRELEQSGLPHSVLFGAKAGLPGDYIDEAYAGW